MTVFIGALSNLHIFMKKVDWKPHNKNKVKMTNGWINSLFVNQSKRSWYCFGMNTNDKLFYRLSQKTSHAQLSMGIPLPKDNFCPNFSPMVIPHSLCFNFRFSWSFLRHTIHIGQILLIYQAKSIDN
jgi:hypothetical protein